METYKVKYGENIFDVALKLYGSIEGIFDLLISNDTSINGKPLSINTLLTAGTELNYHTEFIINNDIKEWISDNSITVKNGEHIFEYCDSQSFISEYLEKYNAEIIKTATELYSGIYVNGVIQSNYDADTAIGFFNYINTHYIGAGNSYIGIATINFLRQRAGNTEVYEGISVDEETLWNEN